MKNTLAFVFPGQGSQQVGMLAALAAAYPIVEQTFAEASQVFGQDLWALTQNGPEAELNLTEITQPVMLVAGVAVWRAWQTAVEQASDSDIVPAFMAGHSLGEYTAYVCAQSLSLETAVALVKIRGELMRDACPGGQGKMAAIIGLDDEIIKACCQEAAAGQVVQAVNFNAPGQVVIAGHNEAVHRAIDLCKEQGARRALPLPVSVPCHSDLMQPASEELAKALANADFQAPQIPVVNNLDAGIELNPDNIREKLVQQLYRPVLWVDSVNKMFAEGVTQMVECGPGKVLSGMNKRIQKPLTVANLQDPESVTKTLELLAEPISY